MEEKIDYFTDRKKERQETKVQYKKNDSKHDYRGSHKTSVLGDREDTEGW